MADAFHWRDVRTGSSSADRGMGADDIQPENKWENVGHRQHGVYVEGAAYADGIISQRIAGDIQSRQATNASIAGTLVNTFAPLLLNTAMMVFYLILMLKQSLGQAYQRLPI